ncbi:MAG: hypothetical protein ACREGI_03825, partial [Candidatus Levyibacteriota bacterium]
MFCGFLTTWMGYATLDYAILFLPLALFFIQQFFEKKQMRYGLFLAITVPLSFFSGHFQISIYFFSFLVIYIIFKGISFGSRKGLLVLLFFLLCGFFLSMPQILPSVEFYLLSVRSAIFQGIEIIPWSYVPTFLAPDFFGNPVTGNNWFGHYAEWSSYIGVIPFMLAFYSLSVRKSNKHILFFFIVSIIVILFAFNSPVSQFTVFLHIPVFSTSAAGRIIVLFSFLFAVLSGFGFDALSNDVKNRKIKRIFLWLGIFSILFLLLWTVILFHIFIPLMWISVAKKNLLLPTILYGSFSLLIIIFLSIKQNRKKIFLFSLITLLLVGFDLLRFAKKWQPFESKNLIYASTSFEKGLEKIKGNERVLGRFGEEVSVYYRLSSVEGYDSLYNARYGEFISTLDSGKLSQPARNGVNFPRLGVNTSKALDFLNIQFILHKRLDDKKSWELPYWNYPPNQFSLVYQDKTYQLFKNNNAYPRAFLVGNYLQIQNPQKIIDTLFAKSTNLL